MRSVRLHKMRGASHILIAAFLITPVASYGGWIDRSGVPLTDSPDRKSIGDFGAQFILVGDENALLEVWNAPSDTVHVSTIDSTGVGAPVNAFIVFGGCLKDKTGNCNVTVTFRVLDPKGGIYADTPAMEVWRKKPAPRGRSLGLSVDYSKFRSSQRPCRCVHCEGESARQLFREAIGFGAIVYCSQVSEVKPNNRMERTREP